MSKLSFRARALDASRPMAVFLGEELPDLPDHSAISRAVPAMPTGMEKDEESEHHLQRAICAGLIIPTPEVSDMPDAAAHDRLYPPDYTKPRQLIHMQPLGLEQEVPDYDMDSEDERWLRRQQAAGGGRVADLTELKFEETMEKLERGSGQTVVTLREARALAGRNGPAEHVLAAVYDYWLNKRLATQQPLLLAVRTEPRPGAPQASPYLAFRRRTEKMQTRKNRKNDESSYEKMVKLRRELSQVVSLLDLVRQRERLKKDSVRLTAAIIEKRYAARDFGGNMIAEAKAARVTVTSSLLMSSFVTPHHRPLDSSSRQRDRRQYKRRKHRHHSSLAAQAHSFHHGGLSGSSSSSDGETNENGVAPPAEPCGQFTFRRKPGCQYHMPTIFDNSDDIPWMLESCKENAHPGRQDPRHRYALASINYPKPRCVGFVRRRMGRGGRVILDRLSVSPGDDRLWESLGYTITDTRGGAPSPVEKPQFDFEKARLRLDTASSIFNDNPTEKILFNPNRISSDDFVDVTVKRETDDEFSDSEKLSRLSDLRPAAAAEETSDSESLSSCDEPNIYNSKFSFNGDTLDRGRAFKRYRDRNERIRSAKQAASSMYREDMKVMAELLVARRLAHCERRVPDMSLQSVDSFLKDVWGKRLHFKPKLPPENAQPMVREENEVLTENSPITVHVRLASLPDVQQPPSDCLLSDSSPFITSEFTLADIYGDSIIDPNPDEDGGEEPRSFRDISWGQTNGPKYEDVSANCGSMDVEKSTFKSEASDNSSSNQTSVFLSSEGGPPSTNSVNSDAFSVMDDSNHEANGVIFDLNETVESDNIKHLLKKAGNGLANKCKSNSTENASLGSSTVVKVEPLLSNQRIYSDCDRPASPSFSILTNNLANQSPTVSPEKRTENLAIVQLKSPILPQSKVKQVLKSVLTTTDGVQKVEGVKLRAIDELPKNQQQHLVTLSVPDTFKLRLPGRYLSGAGATNASEILGLVQHKSLTANSIPKDGVANVTHRTVMQTKPVRLVPASSLSLSQRSKLIRPGSVQLRGIANLFQLQVRTPHKRTETVEPAQQPSEAASAPNNETTTPSTSAPATTGAPSTSGKPPPSPRKGQASLPMEVT